MPGVALAMVDDGRVDPAFYLFPATGAGSQTAGIRYNGDGSVDANINGVYTQQPTGWYQPMPGGAPGNRHWIRATLNSGTSPSGSALNTWLALSSGPEWTITDAVVGGQVQSSLNIEFADDAAGANIISLQTPGVTLQADRTS